MSDNPQLANFIIGGTEKAGTTSVFMYLSEHPQVCAASHKETDFFREEYRGDAIADRTAYGRYFSRCSDEAPVVMEASPSYLGEAETVAARMHRMLPEARLLFILRDPIDRLYSSFNFHVGKLNIPQSLSFADYVDKCMDFYNGTASADQLGLDEWYLKVLSYGCYGPALQKYLELYPRSQVKVMFFERLGDDPGTFMQDISDYLEIDSTFWSDFEFRRTNITFSGRIKFLHKMAMYLNTVSEPFLRRRPGLKAAIVDSYKFFNQSREGYDPMASEVKSRLASFYAPSNEILKELLPTGLPESWEEVTS